jgi:hypothetical protein
MRINSETFTSLNSSVSGEHANSILVSSFWIYMGDTHAFTTQVKQYNVLYILSL